MRQATLLFLIKDDSVLLAMKKRGFGVGKWNGVGGKPNTNESIEQTAIRECREEIGVTPVRLQKVATINFYFPADKPDWDQQVIVFLCNNWQGTPQETEEMAPKWFSLGDIPYADMWADDPYWVPQVLAGQFVEADFYFDNDNKVIKKKVNSSRQT